MILAVLFAAALQHWLVINDIHLDPYSKRGIVRHEDTTPDLWHATLPELRAAVPHPSVIILGGDMLAHHFLTLAKDAKIPAEQGVLQTDREIARDLSAIYPAAQFLVAEGNNDDPCGDYRSETDGAYQRELARIWEPLVNRHAAAPRFMQEFSQGGYYTARLPVHNGEAIVLNSVLWSIVYSGGCLSHPHDPGKQEFAWLDATLAALPAHSNAVVLMHIPPGFDANSTTDAHRFLAVPFLNGGANQAFIADMKTYAASIREIFGAHTHRYDFRIVGGVPMFIASSVSPVYKNNPAFYDVTVDENGTIVDIVPYAYHVFDGDWEREPSFTHMYGIHAFDAQSLGRVASLIRTDPQTRATWKEAYDVWSWRVGDLDNDWLPFACAQTEIGPSFAECAHTSGRTALVEVTAGSLIVVVLAGAVFLVARRRRR